MNILQAFGLVALGMSISHVYNWMGWRKYYEGMRVGRAEVRTNK